MNDALPLIAEFHPHAVFAWHGSRPVTQGEFIAQAQVLAQQLTDAPYVLNLCEDRYRFTLTFCAATLRGHINLLPHSNAPAVIEALKHRHPHHQIFDDGFAISDAAMATQAPLIAASKIVAQVMTSGSTGTARCLPKRWDVLARTALLSHAALLRGIDAANIVATVPPQHMFGLETSVFYALATGCAVHHARPFFPADIRDALAAIPAPRVLVTTPIHLRALLQSQIQLPPLALMLSATAPLSPDLAQQAEQRFDAPLREIYGCTEAGSLATRQLTTSAHWTLHKGSRIVADDKGVLIHAAHQPEAIRIDDEVAIDDAQHFQWIGRSSDLLKVAGKRASISELTQRLLQVAGVEDAVVFVPDGQERPAALVVAPTLTAAQILSQLAPQFDAVFLPRPLKRVTQLPRNSVGKLPRAALMELLTA